MITAILIIVAIWFFVNFRKAKLNVDLLDASFSGNITRVQEILRTNVDINCQDKNGFTPLIMASAQGHILIVKLLLLNGANPRICDFNGLNAQAHAAMMLKKETFILLTKYMETGEL